MRLLTGERDGYYQDFGRAEDLAKSLTDVFVYDGCYSPFHRRRHGSRRIAGADAIRCVRAESRPSGKSRQGDRFGAILSPPAAQRLACGLLLLSPFVPLLFMGEEYGETRPFPFFCSFSDPGLSKPCAADAGKNSLYCDSLGPWKSPTRKSPDTFLSAKLAWAWPEGSLQAKHRRLYQDLLSARRQWPALRDREHTIARLLDPDSGGQAADLPFCFSSEARTDCWPWRIYRRKRTHFSAPGLRRDTCDALHRRPFVTGERAIVNASL